MIDEVIEDEQFDAELAAERHDEVVAALKEIASELAPERNQAVVAVLQQIAKRENTDILKGLSTATRAIESLNFASDLSKIESVLSKNNELQANILKEMRKTIHIQIKRTKIGLLDELVITKK